MDCTLLGSHARCPECVKAGRTGRFQPFRQMKSWVPVSRGGTLELLGFLFTRVCINTWLTYGWPPHVLGCYVNVIEVMRYQLADLKGLWMDYLYIYIHTVYISIHIIYNICLHVQIYIIAFIWHQNISERNNYMQLRDMFEQSFPSGSDQFLAGFREATCDPGRPRCAFRPYESCWRDQWRKCTASLGSGSKSWILALGSNNKMAVDGRLCGGSY